MSLDPVINFDPSQMIDVMWPLCGRNDLCSTTSHVSYSKAAGGGGRVPPSADSSEWLKFLWCCWSIRSRRFFCNNGSKIERKIILAVCKNHYHCYLVLIQLTCLTDLETCCRTVCMIFPSFQTLTNPPKSADKMDTRSKLPGHLKWYRHYQFHGTLWPSNCQSTWRRCSVPT